MKWLRKPRATQTPADVIAAARRAFEAAAPRTALCDDCAYPIGSKEHEKRCEA